MTTWTITNTPGFSNCWNVRNGEHGCVAGISVEFQKDGARRVLVHFPNAPKFNWQWDCNTIDEAVSAGCAYVRGVERAVGVHAEETRKM